MQDKMLVEQADLPRLSKKKLPNRRFPSDLQPSLSHAPAASCGEQTHGGSFAPFFRSYASDHGHTVCQSAWSTDRDISRLLRKNRRCRRLLCTHCSYVLLLACFVQAVTCFCTRFLKPPRRGTLRQHSDALRNPSKAPFRRSLRIERLACPSALANSQSRYPSFEFIEDRQRPSD